MHMQWAWSRERLKRESMNPATIEKALRLPECIPVRYEMITTSELESIPTVRNNLERAKFGSGCIVLLLSLCACSDSYKFGKLDARYQSPELPVHFRSPKNGFTVSLFASGNNQKSLSNQGSYSVMAQTDTSMLFLPPDTNYHLPQVTIQERYRYRRDAASIGSVLTWQHRWLFSGLIGGLALQHPDDFHLGVFAGCSPKFGRFIPTFTFGLTRNSLNLNSNYWENNEGGLPIGEYAGNPGLYIRDSTSGAWVDWEPQFNLGIMYRWTDGFAPFLTLGGTQTRFWYRPSTSPDNTGINESSLGVGVECRFVDQFPMVLEFESGVADLSSTGSSDYYELKFYFSKEL